LANQLGSVACGDQMTLRRFCDQPQGHLVRYFDARDLLELGAHIGGGFGVGDLLDGPFDVIGGDWLAVVEHRPGTQLEYPRTGIVKRPALCQFALQPAGLIVTDQAAMEEHFDGACGGADALPRRQVGREGGQAIAQRAGRRGRAGRDVQERQCGGTCEKPASRRGDHAKRPFTFTRMRAASSARVGIFTPVISASWSGTL
jgi:hypothetical protein